MDKRFSVRFPRTWAASAARALGHLDRCRCHPFSDPVFGGAEGLDKAAHPHLRRAALAVVAGRFECLSLRTGGAYTRRAGRYLELFNRITAVYTVPPAATRPQPNPAVRQRRTRSFVLPN